MNIKIMVVPGKIIYIEVADGATVMEVARQAASFNGSINGSELVRDREVRVNKKKFSNIEAVDKADGYVGSVVTTPLEDGDIILVLKQIKGNEGGALECVIDGQDYALATPDTIANILRDVVGKNPNDVISVKVNGDFAHLEDLVGDGDDIEVYFSTDAPADDKPEIEVDGVKYPLTAEGKLAAIVAILDL